MTKKGTSAPCLGEVCAQISELTGVEVDADLSTKRQEILDGRTAAHEAAKDVATSMAEERRPRPSALCKACTLRTKERTGDPAAAKWKVHTLPGVKSRKADEL